MYIEKVIGEEEEVTDIAQDCFIKIYEHRKEFVAEENARAFLFIIARNSCLNLIRHKKVEQSYVSEFLDNEENELKDDGYFLRELMREETYRILYAAIGRLPGRTREIISLSVEGNSNEEVAELLDISINTVKVLKSRGYAALRHSLSDELLFLVAAMVFYF